LRRYKYVRFSAFSFFSARPGFIFVRRPVRFSNGRSLFYAPDPVGGIHWLLLCAPAMAQTLGTISGEVKDSTGAIVPGVTVTVINKDTNATRTTSSNAVGLYRFPALPPGPYSVKSELEGFKTVSRDLELQVQQAARVNFTLELGTISEMATVTGVSPLVETTNATIGTVIENRRIVELPLNGRNYLQLVALSPNVSADFAGAGQSGDRQGGQRANQQLSISGQRREFNYYTLDGVDNTDVNFNTYIFLPSVDALEEFKVQTGVYSAEFGREASQVNVVTKSGNEQPARHGVRIPPRRCPRREAVCVQRGAGRRPQGALQVGPVRVYRRRTGVEEPHVLHVELRGLQGRQAVPDPLQRAVRGDAGRQLLGTAQEPRPDQSADGTARRHHRRPDAMRRRRHDADLPAVCQQHHPFRPPRRHLQAAARVLSRAEQRHECPQQQLPFVPGP
jgi:hypothetical protein